MKNVMLIFLIASFVFTNEILSNNLNIVTTNEALNAANNWIILIVEKKGNWGGFDYAEVEEIQKLVRDGKQVGYFCKVNPQGFIIVSLRKELAPIKAYSATACINPESDEGLPALIKRKMANIVTTIESKIGSLEMASTEEISAIVDYNYSNVWGELIGKGENKLAKNFQPNFSVINYGGGDILLKTAWSQRYPYNRFTPEGKTCDHTLVGCTATATAQLMNYWSWPPYGVESPYNDNYDWSNMIDEYYSGITYTTDQLNAVAEINYEVAHALESEFGCDGTSAWIWCWDCTDVEDVLEDNFRYSDSVEPEARDNYTSQEWFDKIVNQINSNQPIIYGVERHAIVCDGWQVLGSTKQYHMNYGWGTGVDTNKVPCGDFNDGRYDCDAWYSLDALYLGDYDIEEMQINIRPAQSLGRDIWFPFYTVGSFPYRYFNVDATGISMNSVFEPGQNLQFLPTVKVIGGTGIKFEGTTSNQTILFSKGNKNRGIKIKNGALVLNGNGGIKFPR